MKLAIGSWAVSWGAFWLTLLVSPFAAERLSERLQVVATVARDATERACERGTGGDQAIVLTSNQALADMARDWFPDDVLILSVDRWCDERTEHAIAAERFKQYRDFRVYLFDSAEANVRERVWLSRLTCDLPDGRVVDVRRGWRPESRSPFPDHLDRRLLRSIAITLRDDR